MTLAGALLPYLVAGAAVVLAGTILARSGDVIAARTRLGGLWVGSIFIAVATSLPELVTDIAAVRMGQPDLAAGDLFGSSMANMLILGLITVLPAGRDLFDRATLDHGLYATLAIILTCIAAALMLARPAAMVIGVGPGSVLLVAVYLVGTRAISRHTAIARAAAAVAETHTGPGEDSIAAAVEHVTPAPLGPMVLRFAGAALLILVAAPRFAHAANDLAIITGLGTTFIGTWLVGMATSLPELATSIAAVRLGAYDLAAGNLFGSNAFNMSLFVVLDAVHGAPLLSEVDAAHTISALVAIALMAAGLSALVYRAKRRFSLLEPSGTAMLLIYLAGLVLVYPATLR